MEITKQCFKCKEEKKLSDFYKHPKMPDGTVNKCKECNKVENKYNWWKRRDDKRDYDLRRHRYSIQRLFNHKYSMIKTRCTKKRKNGKCQKSVFGTSFLSKEEWNKWCREDKNYKQFMQIYNNWVQSGFSRRMTPSIDRVKNQIGYAPSNLQWLTLSDNASKSNK